MSWDIVSAISDYLIYAGAVTGWIGSVEKRLRGHGDRIEDIERRQEGDDEDPSTISLLEQAHELEQDVKQVDEKLEQVREERQAEHQALVDRLETMIDGQQSDP